MLNNYAIGNSHAGSLDARHDENTLAQINMYDPIPFRIASELGILGDCMLYRAGWHCHVRLGVRFQWKVSKK